VFGAGSALGATVRFGSTGAQQTFTVPAGVRTVHVVAIGGHGYSTMGGSAAVVTADLPVIALLAREHELPT
jgi:hypothetical protein